MNKQVFKLSAILLTRQKSVAAMLCILCALLFISSSCEKQDTGTEILYTKYYSGTDEWFYSGMIILWDNLPSTEGEIILINNSEEFGKYFAGTYSYNYWGEIEFGDCPVIDFYEQTLVLAHGDTNSTMVYDCNISVNSFRLFSDNKYKLEIELKMTYSGGTNKWINALITSKLSEESKVELKVIFN